MSYSFDPTSGDTLAQLTDRVLTNAFSASRYTELAHGWLNEAVGDVCRRLRIQRHMEILDYDVDTGVVAQPDNPYFQVEELWMAYGNASGSGEQAVSTGAYYQLRPMPTKMPAGQRSAPVWYTVRRQAQTGRALEPAITVVPATAGTGKVAIVGLQRPAVMAEADDLSGLGGDLDSALVAYARARAFEYEDDFDMATRWGAFGLTAPSVYERELRGVLAAALHTDGPSTTPGTWHEGLLPDGGR